MRNVNIFALIIIAIIFLLPNLSWGQGIHCGGSMGEGCWSPQARESYYDRSGLPRWRGRVMAPVVPYGGPGLPYRARGVPTTPCVYWNIAGQLVQVCE